MTNERVAAIIPAYNEAATIGDVVSIAKSSPLVSEVIVVSDGSTDDTVSIARDLGATVLDLQQNVGKGGAMLCGIRSTDASILLFLDADLVGLTTKHIEQLVNPVLLEKKGMQVGIRDRGQILTYLTRFFPIISGERAMRREIAMGIPERFYQGFSIEPAFNYACKTKGFARGLVNLQGLGIRRKYEKVGWQKAVVQYVSMTRQIVFAIMYLRFARFIGKF